MTNKKTLSAVIKRLDRVIALLDNCYDTGDMSESTRRRLIEMLHTSISDVYSFGKENDTVTEEVSAMPIPEEIQDNETKQAQVAEINVIEETITEPIIEAVQKQEIVAETAEQHSVNENKKEEVAENRISHVLNSITYEDDSLIELESPSSLDYFGTIDNTTEIEPVAKEKITIETPVVQEPLQAQATVEAANEVEESLAKEKAQLAGLRQQLEDERKRLEEELLSWQRERIKREEEMKAAEQLLSALEAETQKRKETPTIATNSTAEQKIEPEVQQPQPVVNKITEPVNPVYPTQQTEPVQMQQKTTLGDRLSEQHQSQYSSANFNDLKRQGITPIADLTRAIGINDKFQFIKELFGGDSDAYADTVRTLNNLNGVEEAFNYIETYFNWKKTDETANRFILLIRRRYMQ